jgi:DNA-binding MarR family transcriptional regulator
MTPTTPPEQLLDAARRFTKAGFFQAQSIAGSSLSRTEWHLLWLLHQQAEGLGARPSDLAKQQRVTAGSVAQTLKTLEAQHLIARTTDTTDRRVVMVTLTSKGVKTFKQARTQMIEVFENLAAGLGEQDAKTFTALLARAADILEKPETEQC